jgi:phosphatidylglycerol---prolipoprotein diacylglyceryl transferase
MFPRLFTLPAFHLFRWDLGPFTLHTYGVLLVLAFVAGLWVAGRQAKKAGLDSARITDMAVYVLLGGLIGAKVLLVVVEWSYYSSHPREIFWIFQSAGVFYGGLLGALPVAIWYARRHHLPGWSTADVLSPGVAIGQAIGRLGCFSAGCCYGRETTVPWGVSFREEYARQTVQTPLYPIVLHPTQLYEAGATLLIFVFLVWLARRRRFEGQVTLAYVVLYAIARFVIEFYRGDTVRGTVFGTWITTSQFIAMILLAGAALLYPYLQKKQRLTAPAAA